MSPVATARPFTGVTARPFTGVMEWHPSGRVTDLVDITV